MIYALIGFVITATLEFFFGTRAYSLFVSILVGVIAVGVGSKFVVETITWGNVGGLAIGAVIGAGGVLLSVHRITKLMDE